MRKTRAMFERARDHLHGFAIHYVVFITEVLVTETRGFGNQKPPDTEYIPTGRLRGGYDYSPTRLAVASRYTGGPFSDYGAETVDRIEAAMRANGVKSFWIVNDVAYAYVVWQGLGRHQQVGPDDFIGRAGSPVTMRLAHDSAKRAMGGT